MAFHDRPSSPVMPVFWHLQTSDWMTLASMVVLLSCTLHSYPPRCLVPFFWLTIFPAFAFKLMTTWSGATCHGHNSGRSPCGSFQYTARCLWDIGSFAPSISLLNSSFCLIVSQSRSPGKGISRSVTHCKPSIYSLHNRTLYGSFSVYLELQLRNWALAIKIRVTGLPIPYW